MSDEEAARRGKLAKKLANSDDITPSLILDLKNSFNILELKMQTADQQRVSIEGKLDKVLDCTTEMRLIRQEHDQAVIRLEALERQAELNTEFRLKFMGGSLVARLAWLALGGVGIWFFENVILKR